EAKWWWFTSAVTGGGGDDVDGGVGGVVMMLLWRRWGGDDVVVGVVFGGGAVVVMCDGGDGVNGDEMIIGGVVVEMKAVADGRWPELGRSGAGNRRRGSSLEDIPRLDTTKSNTYTLKNTSFKKRSTIKLYVPNSRRFASLKGLEQVLEQGPWLIKNIPLMLTKWSPKMSLSKDKVTKVPVWVKLHKVPVVAYSEDGLSLIATQIGNPIMLDAFTSAMCVDAWGRIRYARALIEVSADKELKKEVTMAVPNIDDEVVSHTLEKIKVEYKWKPPYCLECHMFGHAADQCPKHVHEKPKPTVESSDDGFTTVVNKRSRGKGANSQRTNKGSFLKVRVNNPNKNFVYQPVKKASDQKPSEKKGNNVENNNDVKLKNLFEKLNEITSIVDPSSDDREVTTFGDANKKDNTDKDDSDSEVEECSRMEYTGFEPCPKTIGGNLPSERRHLWSDLGMHKYVVRGFPWVLIGDFNVALDLEDYFSSSSTLNSAMYDFKACVNKIEVMDINATGLHFTWNQKPKGGGGVLKKLDRIMGNIDFIDTFLGAYAIFQPYRISDHSHAVLKLPTLISPKPKPFKFFNFLAFKTRFIKVMESHWNTQIDGHNMFKVVSKMKLLKKPLRKLLHDQGNLHERVNKLRLELDEVQKALDTNPADSILREEECVYVQAFNKAKLDEERFLKQKAKVDWLEAGDTNSAYFHKTIKCRNQRSRIDSILNTDNVEVSGNLVPDVFVSHYKQFLGSSTDCNILNKEGLFSNKVPVNIASNMVRDVTNDEIKAAMFDIGDDRAPGPDGYTFVFFKKGWDIVSDDICNAGSPRCAFKINIQKAYDTVDWKFLENILIKFGFHNTMVKWIMACVSSTSFSLSINGLLNRDCKILVEKAKNRIGDWKNKSLSFAGRLQLCKSIISSMHVFWASVLIIPKGIIYEIHQLIRGFLWCNGELKRGKAKIAWEDICLPKSEGGLGFCNLEVFNFALMTTHIWNIISSKESLWVRWIHTYKLRGRTIWDCPVKDEMSLRDIMRPFFWVKLGNGNSTSLWYDNWCSSSPLINYLTLRDISREGFLLTNTVADLVSNGTWFWPQSWLLKAPDLGLITYPGLVSSVADLWQWCDRNGNILSFSVVKAWEAIRPRGNLVSWSRIVWFSHNIPRHAFHLWLVMRHGLKTHDKMRQWDVGGDTDLNLLCCALCDNCPDSHTHLFFECTFSAKVWSYVRDLAGMDLIPPVLQDILLYLLPMGNKRTAKSVFGKLILAASAYFIWMERNNRTFKNTRRTPEEICDLIMVTVRLKLISFRFKNTTVVRQLLERWKMPNNFRLYGN
ncbi:trichome birefringence-like protein 3, partial [Tanacetum coccineum]